MTTHGDVCLSNRYQPLLACRRIQFRSLFFPKAWKELEHQMAMYELEHVRINRRTCSFCHLLLAALSSDLGIDTVTWERSAYVLFNPQPFGCLRVKDESSLLARMNFSLTVDSNQWSTDRNGTVYGHGIQVAVETPDDRSGQTVEAVSDVESWLLKGRRLRFRDRIDLRLARDWLNLCVTAHGATCMRYTTRNYPSPLSS